MKILTAGSNLNAVLLAEYFSRCGHKSYLTSDEKNAGGNYTPAGIKENDVQGALDFVKNNNIDLTAAVSGLAVINGIADEFMKNGFMIAAPASEAARITFFNSTAKKVMYKLKINTPRFGIFDRENIACDYIKHAKYPIVIMNDFTLNERISTVYPSFRKARLALQKIFENKNEKIVIENYMDEDAVYMYFLTDGCNAVHLISIERKENENFTEIKAPSAKIDLYSAEYIMKKAVFPLLDDTSEFGARYAGILGLKIKQSGGRFYVIECYNDFQSADLQTFLALLDEDAAELFMQAAAGRLQTRAYTEIKPEAACTYVINNRSIVSESIDDEGFITASDGFKTSITKTAASYRHAAENLREYLEPVCSEDIYKEILKAKEKAERY